jgi:hypothetical protein
MGETREREKLVLTREEAREIVYDGSDEFTIISDKIEDTTRWSEIHDVVIKRNSDGKLFADGYTQGLTEYQDESPYEYSDPDFNEVFETQKLVTVYE